MFMTIPEALAQAPASASKTALEAAATAFEAAINNAKTAGHIGSKEHATLRDDFVDYLENLAINLSA